MTGLINIQCYYFDLLIGKFDGRAHMRSGVLKTSAVVLVVAMTAYYYGRKTKEEDLKRDAGSLSSLLMSLSLRDRMQLLLNLINSEGIRPSMFGTYVKGRAIKDGDRSGYQIRPYRSPFVGAHTAMFVDSGDGKPSILLCYNTTERRYEVSGGYMQPMNLKTCGASSDDQVLLNLSDAYDKDLAHTAQREHREETGLNIPVERFHQLKTLSDIEQNKRNAHSVDAFYYAVITQAEFDGGVFGELKAASDVSGVKLVPMDELEDFSQRHRVRKDHLAVVWESYNLIAWALLELTGPAARP